jgi:tetratricopeptide (TPR) repeat protein
LLNTPGLQPLRKDLLELALKYYKEFTKQRSDDLTLQADLGAAYFRVGKITFELGATEEPIGAYEQAVDIRKNLVAASADDALNDLAETYRELERALRRDGKFEEALVASRQAIEIWKKLAAEHPTVPAYKHGLAASYYFASHSNLDVTETLPSCEKAVAISESLVAENPDVLDYQLCLANSVNRLGSLQKAAGNLDDALASCQRALGIRERLADACPENSGYRYLLGGSYHNLASLKEAAGRRDEAIVLYEKSIEVGRSVAEANPTVADYQRFLSKRCEQLARLRMVSGQRDEAMALYAETTAIREQLVAAHPEVALYRDILVAGYCKRADAWKGLAEYESALADCDKAIALEPENPSGYFARAKVHLAMGYVEEALADYTTRLKYSRDPPLALRQRATVFVLFKRYDEAIVDYTNALELNPTLPDAYYGRGAAYIEMGDFEKAVADLHQAMERAPENVIYSHYVALAHIARDDLDEYRRTCDDMWTKFRGTEDADEQHWVAWTCALAPDAIPDLSAAVSLSAQAVESEPKSIIYLGTLRAILYRAGRFEEAIERLHEGDRLVEEAEPGMRSSPATTAATAYNWYFLAMAHHRLGQAEEANKWLEKAGAWTDRVLREHEDGTIRLGWSRRVTLKLFRDEAEALIGKDEG